MKLFDLSLFSFNFYSDVRFWIVFALAAILFRSLRARGAARNALLGLFSLAFLFALPRFTIFTFLLMLIVSCLTYASGVILHRGTLVRTGKSKYWLSFFSISFVILFLAFFKYNGIQAFFNRVLLERPYEPADFIFLIGISYSSFKMMHFLIECYKGKIDHFSLLDYLNYIFFFPAFISGPINRYNPFIEQLNTESSTNLRKDIAIGAERIVHGLFKKFVLSMIVFRYTLANMPDPLSEMSLWKVLLGLYAYSFYFYFDFSGYTDMAIGCARVFGYELPENFNNPFTKRNIQELWANWHMSLTRWLTDYIYWPLSKKLRKVGYFKKRPILLSNISIITTFIICGMWHGSTYTFILWGMYHGLGLATLNIYRSYKRRIRNRHIRGYFQSRISPVVGVVATFHFFVVGIALFILPLESILTLVKRIFGIS